MEEIPSAKVPKRRSRAEDTANLSRSNGHRESDIDIGRRVRASTDFTPDNNSSICGGNGDFPSQLDSARGDDSNVQPAQPAKARRSISTVQPEDLTTGLSRKEMALYTRKRRSSFGRLERKWSLDLLDPEWDLLPGSKPPDMEQGGFVISPDTPLVTYWLLIVYLLTVYNFIVIPFRMAFGFLSQKIGFWFYFDLFTDCIFMMDIYLSHHIGFYVKGRLILNLNKIGQSYRSSWFFPIDICASLPVDFIQIHYDRIVPAARLPKLLRALHLFQLINSIENQPGVPVTAVRLSKLVMSLIFINHLSACAFWNFASDGFPELLLTTSMQQYIASMYWATSNMVGNAYFSTNPSTSSQSLLSLVFLIISIMFVIYLTSTIVSLIDNEHLTVIEFQNRVDYILRFLSDQGLSKNAKRAVIEYFSFLWESHRGFDKEAVMAGLPASLSLDIQVFLTKDIVSRCRFFASMDPGALSAVVNMLQPRVCAPGEFVIHAGVKNVSMYFVQYGKFDVLLDGATINTLVAGDFFGEMQMMLGDIPTTSIRAMKFSEVYEFSREHFNTLLEMYPADAQNLLRTAKQFSEVSDPEQTFVLSNLQNNVNSMSKVKRIAKSFSSTVPTPPRRFSKPYMVPNSHDSSDLTSSGGSVPNITVNVESSLKYDLKADASKTTSEIWKPESELEAKISVQYMRALQRSLMNIRKLIRIEWELMTVVATLYNLTVIPLRLAFVAAPDVFSPAFISFDILCDALLIADCSLRFIWTSTYSTGIHAAAPQVMHQEYVRKQFPCHMLASAPFDWVAVLIAGFPTSILLRTFRIIRIDSMMNKLFRNELNFKSHAKLLSLKVLFIFFIAAHWISALWVLLSEVDRTANGYDPTYAYLMAQIVAIRLLTGNGSFRKMSTSVSEMVLSIAVSMIGLFFMSFAIGSLAFLITERNSLSNNFSRKLITTRQFMDFRNVPQDIHRRVQGFFDNTWSTMRGVDPQLALQSLPSSVRTEIMIEMCKNIIKDMPLFEGAPERFIYDLVPRLEYEVFPAQEFIFRKGQMSNNKMYFATRGILSIILDEKNSSRPFKLIGTGSFFGECALLTKFVRRASIRTETPCHLMSMSRHHLFHMLRIYPAFKERIQTYAIQRIKRLTKTLKNMDQILQEVVEQIEESRLIANRTYNFVMFESCFVGSEFVDWIISRGYADNREDAVAIGTHLYETELIRPVGDGSPAGFHDDLMFYRLGAYVDRMAKVDIPIHQVQFREENAVLMNDLRKELCRSDAIVAETNLLSSDQIVKDLIRLQSKQLSEDDAVALGQRLLDFSVIQHVQDLMTFAKNKDFYRIRCLNLKDPQNCGPSVSAILSGKTPAFAGHIILYGTHTMTSHYAALSRGFPGVLYVFESRESTRPTAVWDVFHKSFSLSKLQDTRENSTALLYCITLIGRDFRDKRILSVDDPASSRRLILCFDNEKRYDTILDIIKAQGYTQKVRSLAGSVWK